MNGYFFDMDGTLYNNRFHEVSEKTFKMLNELQSQGHFVALSTSRCQSELKNLPSCMRSFQFDCMISDGGALILDKQKEDCFNKTQLKQSFLISMQTQIRSVKFKKLIAAANAGGHPFGIHLGDLIQG